MASYRILDFYTILSYIIHMEIKELLYQYNPWWEGDYDTQGIIERPKYQDLLRQGAENRKILLITGLRRVGKTTLMKLFIKELINKKTPPESIFYISLDDYLIVNKDIFRILDEYRRIKKIRYKDKIYLFLDEIASLENYHQQLKNLYDRYNCLVVASSSSSSILKDKKALLTGRSSIIEINPLDFNEYKRFKSIEIKERDNQLNDSYFRDYIKEGGLPENVLNPHREYLMGLVDDIIHKDITAYYGLKNHKTVREFFHLLMERSGKQISINKIANILKISPDTAKRYLHYFEETFLIHLLPRWGKTNEQILSANKVYACDLGIKYLFTGKRDLGSYFENYVYLRLRGKKELYYVYQHGTEIDFYTHDKTLIETKFNSDLTDKQKKLMNEFKAEKKIVIGSVTELMNLENIQEI